MKVAAANAMPTRENVPDEVVAAYGDRGHGKLISLNF